MARKQLSLLLLIIILLIPAIHKILGPIPAAWFIEKFDDSIIGKVPGGISISYYIIILLECIAPLLLLTGLIQMTRQKEYQNIVSLGFLSCYTLFIILTFGSFLVQDYDNGFKDFMYFVGAMLIEHFMFPKNKSSKSF